MSFQRSDFFRNFFRASHRIFFCETFFLLLESSSKNRMLRNYDGVFRGTFFAPNALYFKKFDAKPFFRISLALQLHCNMDAALHCNGIATALQRVMQSLCKIIWVCNAMAMRLLCNGNAKRMQTSNATAMQLHCKNDAKNHARRSLFGGFFEPESSTRKRRFPG